MISRALRRHRFMREHHWTHAHLSDYVEHDLDGARRERVEKHTSICPQCRQVLATLRRTLAGLRELRQEPGADIAGGVIESLRENG